MPAYSLTLDISLSPLFSLIGPAIAPAEPFAMNSDQIARS